MTNGSQRRAIVITGCSSGFGRTTALHLARRGWRVFATVRKEGDRAGLIQEAAAQDTAGHLEPVLCDITDAGQVAALAQTVAAGGAGLDALLNNAGTSFPGPLELLPLEDFRAQLEINLVAQLAVTQALLPLLRAARGIVVNVSSIGGKWVVPTNGAYSVSKFGLEAMSDALRLELAPFGVRVVVIEPGASPTGIWSTSLDRALAVFGEPRPDYAPLIRAARQTALAVSQAGFPPLRFAELVEGILRTPNPRPRYAIPARVGWLIRLRALLPDEVVDWIIRRRLKW